MSAAEWYGLAAFLLAIPAVIAVAWLVACADIKASIERDHREDR